MPAIQERALIAGQLLGSIARRGTYRRRRWRLSYTAGGMTYPQTQGSALGRCNSDRRTHGRCQFRTATCANEGRQSDALLSGHGHHLAGPVAECGASPENIDFGRSLRRHFPGRGPRAVSGERKSPPPHLRRGILLWIGSRSARREVWWDVVHSRRRRGKRRRGRWRRCRRDRYLRGVGSAQGSLCDYEAPLAIGKTTVPRPCRIVARSASAGSKALLPARSQVPGLQLGRRTDQGLPPDSHAPGRLAVAVPRHSLSGMNRMRS